MTELTDATNSGDPLVINRKLEAEARKAEAEARKAEAEAREVEHTVWELELHREAIKASDEFNHVYRFSTSVSDKSVKECMRTLTMWSRQNPGCDIEIIFSSPGGEVVSGMALFDFIIQLREAGHYITTGNLGMAASMAGVLLQAGDYRWMGEQAWILIHRASFMAFGSTYEVEDEVDWAKRVEERMLEIFETRSNLTKQKIRRNWDRKDWWITAEEAYEFELVDEVRGVLVGDYTTVEIETESE